LTGSFASGLLVAAIGYLSLRNSDNRKMAHEDLKSNRQIVREAAITFSEVCSSVLEKAIDSRGIVNTVMDTALSMEGKPDMKVARHNLRAPPEDGQGLATNRSRSPRGDAGVS
jgi:hypothetical protein